MVFFFLLCLVVLALAYVCLTLLFQCAGMPALSLGGRTLRFAPSGGGRGQVFTRAMGRRAVLWALGVLFVTYSVSFVYCSSYYGKVDLDIFLRAWEKWDASNYIRIAELGYDGFTLNGMHTTLVFFPLYPWMMRLVHLAVDDWRLCGHIVSCLCYVGACYVFARLVTEDFGWSAARLALALLSAYPFAFFFAATFGESLFLLLTGLCFLFIRRHRWLLAGLTGALAAMTRMQGLVLLPAAAVEYCVSERPLQKLRRRDFAGLGRDFLKKLLPLALVFAGTGVYLYMNWKVDGNPFQFVIYQQKIWNQSFAPLPKCLATIWEYIHRRWNQDRLYVLWAPELAVFLLSLVSLLYARRRLPPAWTAYFLFYLVMNYSLAWPISCGRYMACAFPLFAALGRAGERHMGAGLFMTVLFAIFQTAYLFTYFAGGQVM